MRDFSFHRPASLEETYGLLSEYGEDARLLSGGTALVVMMKQSLVLADHLVSLQGVPRLRDIDEEDGVLRIGALASHRDVETSGIVQRRLPFLADLYRRVATVRIRNQATVGGGLAHGDPAQDPPPALMVLGASVKISSEGGERLLPIGDLFTDYYETAVEPGEVITELVVPVLPVDARTTYLRYTPRTADDYPTVSVAVWARSDGGVCQDVRVALGAAASTPLRASAVEGALQGRIVTRERLREAAASVAEAVDPLDDYRGSAGYKRDMAVVFTRRALERAFGLDR